MREVRWVYRREPSLDDKVKKSAILVAGMHRSGTSAVSRVLSILGCTLPKTLSGSAPDNERGFWESLTIKDLNDRILASAGSAWDDWEAFNPCWYASPVADEFREQAQTILEDEFGDGQLFVLKDPRICRLLPFWIDAARRFGAEPLVVLPVRNPLDVATSLEVRDGIHSSIGLLMWLRHLLDAEAASRDLKRACLRYERLVSEPHSVVDTLGDTLEIIWPKRSTATDMAVDGFLSPELRHHRSADAGLLANPRLSHWIRSSFTILDRWASGKVRKRDMSRLDRIRTALDDAAPVFGRAVAVGLTTARELDTVRANLDAVHESLARREAQVDALSLELDATNTQLDATNTQLDTVRANLDAVHESLARREAQVDALSLELDATNTQLDATNTQLDTVRANLDAVHESLARREAQVDALSLELDARNRTLAKREGRIGQLSLNLSATRIALNEREVRGRRLSIQLSETQAALAETQAGAHAALAEAQAALADHHEQFEGLSAELSAMWATLAERTERIVHLDTNLSELTSSTSWRLTAPIRYVGIRVKQAVRYMKFIALALRTPGAIGKTLRRVWAVFRRGGAGAVVQRLRLAVEDHAVPAQHALSSEDQRREFVPLNAESEPDIFILSIINWDFRFQRPQHLAIEFARSGRRVFYVEMILEPDRPQIVKICRNLYKVRLSAKETGYIEPYTGEATDAQKAKWFEAFSALCDSVEATPFKHIIIQHPFWWQMVRSVSPEFHLIHDCMDDISGFSNTNRFVQDLEEEMIASCDMLVVSSETLFDKLSENTPRLVRNAADMAHFSSGNDASSAVFAQNLPPLQLQSSDSGSARSEVVKVGYVGAIAEWFDAELVRNVALNRADFELHLCGSVSDREVKRLLHGVDNLHLYGEISYVEVPSFLARMDVLIIPFKIIPIVNACDPIKFYEYSAMGKPTVATRLPELARASDLVFFASTMEEFSSQIEEAYRMGRDPEFSNKLRDFALQNSWKQRSGDFIRILQDFPLVSVVVLSYGDVALTEASVHSLFDRGLHYPNLEVLVVDNGSPPAAVDRLKSFVSRYPGVSVIENGANLGFAKGNNVGLLRATGDYVLLLNNDTYVAPGAVHAMVRHLARNPDIGAVGPLTNNIGNEARVSVGYRDMEHMKKVARRLALGFRGRSFHVESLAYFAVMFRRSDLERFGLLPEDYGLGMFEDDDHCRIIQSKGCATAVAEDGFVHHHLSASFETWDRKEKEALFEKNKATFEKKWGPWKAHQYRTSRPQRVL